MLVPLVPFFLAANISATEGDWKHGAEVTFDARTEGWSPIFDDAGQSIMFNASMKINCQAGSNSSFVRCYFTEPRFVVNLFKGSEKSRVLVKSKNILIKESIVEHPFDLYFSKDELRYKLVTSSDAKYPIVQMAPMYSNLLNIATNGTEVTGEYDFVEHSNLGDCKIKYTVQYAENAPNYVGEENSPYRMTITPESKNSSSRVLCEITKIRDVGTCFMRYITDRRVVMQLKKSVSYARITEDDFTSFTENEVIFRNIWNPNDTGRIAREKITLSLNSIHPAVRVLADIKRPSTRGRETVFDLFHSDAFEQVVKGSQGQFEFWLKAASKKP